MTGEEQVQVDGRWSSNQPRELLPCPRRTARTSSAGTNASCRPNSRSFCIILLRSGILNVPIIGWLVQVNFQPRHRCASPETGKYNRSCAARRGAEPAAIC